MTAAHRTALAAVCLLSGCEQDLLHDMPDAGPDAGDAAPGTMDVHGTSATIFHTDTGTITRTADLTGFQFKSFTPAGGSFVARTGSGAADGTFVVPVGEGAASWDLAFGDSLPIWHLIGGATSVDLSSHRLGRPDAVQAFLATPVTVDATGLAAWGTIDDLQIVSSNAGAIVAPVQGFFASPPAAGATSIASKTFEWEGHDAPIVEAGAGDTAIMTQLVTKMSAHPYAALAKAGTATGFTQVIGQPSTFTVALADVPQRSLSLHWKRGQLEALRPSAGPSATTAGSLLVIDALPGGPSTNFFGSSPDLVELPPPAGTADLDETVAYGNPFTTAGTAWGEYVQTRYTFDVPVIAAGATTGTTIEVEFSAWIPVSAIATDVTIEPVITGVRDIAIAGRDALAPQAGSGSRRRSRGARRRRVPRPTTRSRCSRSYPPAPEPQR